MRTVFNSVLFDNAEADAMSILQIYKIQALRYKTASLQPSPIVIDTQHPLAAAPFFNFPTLQPWFTKPQFISMDTINVVCTKYDVYVSHTAGPLVRGRCEIVIVKNGSIGRYPVHLQDHDREHAAQAASM